MAPLKMPKPYPTLVEERAHDTPDRAFAIIPKTAALEDGYTNLTYAQLERGMDKMSWWLDEQLGSATNFETFAYIGASDHRYTLLCLAATKTGRQVLLPLFQNSDAAMINLMESTNCQTLLSSEDKLQRWDALGSRIGNRRVFTVPSFEYFFNDTPVERYPFVKTWEEIQHDPAFILHTSGSTGLPKPIRFTNHTTATFLKGNFITAFANRKIIVPLPPSWSLGLFLHFAVPLDFGLIPISIPADAPLPMTAEYMDRIHTSIADCDGGVYVPDVLQELVKNPTYVDNMKKIRLVAFGGAPLAKEAGDLLAKFTTVLSIIGSTEGGPYGANLLPDPQDWEWFQFDLVSTGLHFIHFHDDLYESVFKRIKHDNGANQPIFQAFPELDEYPTKDLWRAHKTKKDYWTHSGRVDDFVKLSSLTKFSANHIEKVLLRNNRVKGAVMGGDARPVPYLLVELADGEKEVEALDDLWVLIQEINATISTDIRLEKEMIFFTSPEKPMVRVNNKNTCQRRGTNELYANEVEGLYRRRAGFLNGSLQNGHSSIARSSKGTTAS